MFSIYEVCPDGQNRFTLWDSSTDLDEAREIARELQGYVMDQHGTPLYDFTQKGYNVRPLD